MSRSRYLHTGNGLVNSVINRLPIELHIPGYQYCGPGTKLAKRLKRGDPGINKLDRACKDHDIAYSQNNDNLGARHEADKVLENKALERVFDRDSSAREKIAAFGVASTMKIKRKLGMGLKLNRNNNNTKDGRKASTTTATLNKVKKLVKTAIKSKVKSGRKVVDDATARNVIKTALRVARRAVKKYKPTPSSAFSVLNGNRVIPLPKTGGILPLIPIFAGLSALGALTGGAAGVAKAVIDAKAAKKQLEESKRHNQTMEAIAIGKGVEVMPTKKGGYGLYLSPYPKNH